MSELKTKRKLFTSTNTRSLEDERTIKPRITCSKAIDWMKNNEELRLFDTPEQ